MSNQSIVVNPDVLRDFSVKYYQSADAWINVANQLQLILDQFDEEASRYTETGKPMPVTADTRNILYQHFINVVKACQAYSETIKEDAEGIAYLADAFEENEEVAIAALNSDHPQMRGGVSSLQGILSDFQIPDTKA